MVTRVPVSTISFNTEDFLQRALQRLLDDHIILYWYYVKHFPEDDECGNKEHFHLMVIPSRQIDTEKLAKYFYQFDITMPEKPRKCIQWRKTTSFADWYLYGIHDKSYLASKNQSRRYHYSYEDVRTNDEDELYYSVSTIDRLSLSPYDDMLDSIKQGITWEQYFCRGHIPINQLASFRYAYEILFNDITNRNGRAGHE